MGVYMLMDFGYSRKMPVIQQGASIADVCIIDQEGNRFSLCGSPEQLRHVAAGIVEMVDAAEAKRAETRNMDARVKAYVDTENNDKEAIVNEQTS